MFKGSFNALVVGAGASLVMSLYLEFFPFKNPFSDFSRKIRGIIIKK